MLMSNMRSCGHPFHGVRGGVGAAAPILAFSMEDAPQHAAGFFTLILAMLFADIVVWVDRY